jgi:hypothetical protein
MGTCEQNGRWYLQFNEEGVLNCNSADVRYTPNGGEDCDTCPGGLGLFQLTMFTDQNDSTRPPNSQELWSWKANAITGCKYLEYHQSIDIGNHMSATTYVKGERAQAFLYSSNLYWVPDETVGGVTFSDNTDRIIEHAVAIKRYNGASGPGNGEYIEWVDELNLWRFNRVNSLGFNYVERVCLEVE